MPKSGTNGSETFLSTPSARRATRYAARIAGSAKFLSTPSARRATCEKILSGEKTVISIHALREEGDACTHPVFDVAIVFLSTPSARRATSGDNTQSLPICDFYPRPPRGGRPSAFPPGRPGCRISIHALREEGDSRSAAVCAAIMRFLSTPSARRATRRGRSPGAFIYISIHALREEGDLSLIPLGVVHSYFYPRPPRGGRRHAGRRNHHLHRDFYPRPPRGGRLNYLCYNKSVKRFLSTPSARRATRAG